MVASRRRPSRVIHVGPVAIGGNNPISVQSMTNTDTRNVDKTVQQIKRLEEAGCEIVRVAVVDEEAARSLKSIKERIDIPLIADIHFDHRLALMALDSGVDGLRINPGNIGSRMKVEEVARKAKDLGVPIRVGVNAGSLEKRLLKKHGGLTAAALVESALDQVAILENISFTDLKISIKASHVPLMIEAYRQLAKEVPYPLHLGVTEAGTLLTATVKSSVGIGILLSEGIGDTLRVSITGDPVLEVKAGFEILKSLGLRQKGIELISCPTCGRCEIDLLSLVREVEDRLSGISQPLKIAIMGCPVNGPGEAKQADIGIAGGPGWGLLFKEGEIIARVPQERLVEALLQEIQKMV
ncbi:MAG: flavodoxin-dependent (E)-4-hydroxy-3-methylbut-2-enyl-diphosphate synthase [Clostridia bacterium]|jgi:(E)-4-hydroxy-3-methylbut-2-enyl-diphosphate synthase|nr:flavodoxin-dependent (E)-4-hydroxy-3-methylbut-2-enyl-diphosphate synthase [Clostridia bacterium]